MKPSPISSVLRPGGILRWSTFCILAGLTGCEDRYVATEKDVEMAGIQKRIDELDQQKQHLLGGSVPNNFYIPGVGYYHARVGNFFEYPYGHVKDGIHFINGEWAYFPMEVEVPSSRPSQAALKKVEALLEEKEKEEEAGMAGANTDAPQHRPSGFDTTDALLMYWLLAGNRGNFMPGNGFRQAEQRAPAWNRNVEEKRSEAYNYSRGSEGYRMFMQRSKATGTPVKAGQSVRGGFGSSRGGSGVSYGG